MTSLQDGTPLPEQTPRVFVISLKRAEQRRESFVQSASGAVGESVAWEFFDAHQDLASTLSYREKDALIRRGRKLHPRELGCYSSHYSVWEKVAQMDVPHVLILEDDIVIDWKFVKAILDEDLAHKGIHYLKLYNMRPVRFKIVKENFLLRRSLIAFTGFAFGTQAYIITPEGARRFLDVFRQVEMPIDDAMNRDWRHGLPNLALFPAPLFETVGSSTIDSATNGRDGDGEHFRPSLYLRRLVFRVTEKFRRGLDSVKIYQTAHKLRDI